MKPIIGMNARLVAVVLAGCFVPPATFGDPFSWQVAGRYEDMNAAHAMESSSTSVRATWYPTAVDDRAGPYELAPFLNRSSYVTVGTSRSKHREQNRFPALAIDSFGTFPDDGRFVGVGRVGLAAPRYGAFPPEPGIDTSEYAVDGRYVWPGSGWYAGANARRSDADTLPDLFFAQTTLDQDSAGVFAGRYFGTRTTLELGLESESMSQELRTRALSVDPFFNSADPLGIFESLLLRTGVETDTENARLSVRHVGDVGDLGGSTFSLSASIHSSRTDTRLLLPAPTDSFTGIDPFNPPGWDFVAGIPNLMPFEFFESERERQVGLSGALFPTRALGVRLTLSSLDHDTLGTSDLVGLSANWFFVRNAAVEVELIRTGSGSGYRAGLADTDAVAVRVLGRF